MVAGTLNIKSIADGSTIFTSALSRYSIQNNILNATMEGGLKDISGLQSNTAYTVEIVASVEDLNIKKMGLFQTYSFNAGSTTYEDSDGVHTGIAILSNSIMFMIIG